jgi:hypothetical protein
MQRFRCQPSSSRRTNRAKTPNIARSLAWEKTVEYRFLLEVFSAEKVQFVAPLDGDAERAGDGIFSCNSLITLIEFKRGGRDFASERKKFKDWKQASSQLEGVNRCHYIVCADDAFGQLQAAKFFPKPVPNQTRERWTFLTDFKSVLGKGGGVPPDDFIDYLDLLLPHKKLPEKGGGSSAGAKSDGHVSSVAIAFGLNTKTNQLVAVRVEDYLEQLTPGIKEAVRTTMKQFRAKRARASIPGHGRK